MRFFLKITTKRLVFFFWLQQADHLKAFQRPYQNVKNNYFFRTAENLVFGGQQQCCIL